MVLGDPQQPQMKSRIKKKNNLLLINNQKRIKIVSVRSSQSRVMATVQKKTQKQKRIQRISHQIHPKLWKTCLTQELSRLSLNRLHSTSCQDLPSKSRSKKQIFQILESQFNQRKNNRQIYLACSHRQQPSRQFKTSKVIFSLTLVANHNLQFNPSFLTLRFNLHSHNKLSSNLSLQSQSMTRLHYLCLHKPKSLKSRKNTIQQRSCQAQMLGRWAETLSTYPLGKRLNNLKTNHRSRRPFI